VSSDRDHMHALSFLASHRGEWQQEQEKLNEDAIVIQEFLLFFSVMIEKLHASMVNNR
jgi:hypothetical protein